MTLTSNQINLGLAQLRLIRKIKIDPITNCWNWQGCISQTGYGKIRFDKVYLASHRLAFVAWNEVGIPVGKEICHRCDNRRCINPKHLFLGTRSDNIRDMHLKDRGRAKLKVADIDTIRQNYKHSTRHELAAKFGVSAAAIETVAYKITWVYV